MRVAIFTDNDFGKVNGVTTTLKAVLRDEPADIRPRVYTAADVGVDATTISRCAPSASDSVLPRDEDVPAALSRTSSTRARADRIDVVHFTTPGPVGLAAMYVAWRLGVPMVGSFHTHLAAYTEHAERIAPARRR